MPLLNGVRALASEDAHQYHTTQNSRWDIALVVRFRFCLLLDRSPSREQFRNRGISMREGTTGLQLIRSVVRLGAGNPPVQVPCDHFPGLFVAEGVDLRTCDRPL